MSGRRPDVPVPGAEDLAVAVSALVGPVFETLEALGADVLACRESAGTPCTEADLAPLEKRIAPRLAAHPAAAGMGFVAAPGVVAGQERFLLWWQRAGDDLARLRLNFDPASIDVYDYLQMDWFQKAAAGGRRNAFGPYVDYSGSDMYVVTLSVPILRGSEFLGVAGADLVMSRVERRLTAILRTREREAVVVNDERRVLAANTARWVPGARLPALPAPGDGEFAAVAPVPHGPGWVVAVTDRPADAPADG